MHTKLFLICFNSGFFTNQVTNILTEVVPFCKSGHTHTHTHTEVITTIRVSSEVKYMTAFELWFSQNVYGVVIRNGHSLNRMSGVWDKISTFRAFVLEFCYPVIIINVHAVLI